jgi:hypothetical protein
VRCTAASTLNDLRTTIGPMARFVEDLALGLPILAGPHGRDPSTVPVSVRDWRAVEVVGLRVACYTHHAEAQPTPETTATCRAVAQALSALGAHVVEALPPRIEEAYELTRQYWRRPESASPDEWIPDGPALLSSEEVERHLLHWDRFRRTLLAWMADYDLVLTPAAEQPAAPHGEPGGGIPGAGPAEADAVHLQERLRAPCGDDRRARGQRAEGDLRDLPRLGDLPPPGIALVHHREYLMLRVSQNRRFIVHDDGTPFFYLGDTAWELFHRLTLAEAELYLRDRTAKGFTVIQAVALAELDGLRTPNTNGDLPLIDDDPARPNEAYFRHVDAVVDLAASLGLHIGMLPTWGDKWNRKWGVGPEIFTPASARAYGEFIGRRYAERPIIWILGGDRPIETEVQHLVVRAMAEGVRAGDGGRHLIGFHTWGPHSSTEYVHDEPWLDLHMCQSGHKRNRENWRFNVGLPAARCAAGAATFPTIDSWSDSRSISWGA